MNKVVKVYISPSKGDNKISSWEEKINENYGPLSGYMIDLKNGKNINSILLDILKYKGEGMIDNQNYLNIRGIYLEYIKSLQENLEKKDKVLEKEINCLESNSPSSQTVDILLKYGILVDIEFFIPYEKVYKEYTDIMGDNVFKGVNVESPYKKYWDEVFKNIDYVPEKNISFKYSDIKLAAQVLIFSKVKSKETLKLYDITNFISQINTSVNKTSGGNFHIKLHLVSMEDLERGTSFQNNNINITGYTKALFLQSIFRENDLVFIRFEKLKLENIDTNKQIKGRYWDMIGLIDSTSVMSDYNSFDITISGRDLIKLVIDDNNFFIPYQWANNPDTIFGGNGTKIFKRLFSGEYNLEFVRSLKSIENSLGFIFSQLTNIEVLSTDCVRFLKEEYGNDLAKQYTYSQAGRKEKSLNINGIWGIVHFYVDEKISHLRLADASLKSPNGSTMQQVLKICQEPFVEIIADTFVDKYNIIARRPPFTMEEISKSNFFVIGRDSCIMDNLEFNREVYTVYQLIPQGGFYADNSSVALSYLPMVVLDDYTRLWGNRLYSQVYNYMNIDTFNQIENSEKKQKLEKESYIDVLIWLIETTAYLPFTRIGEITIKGDRRIKVGQWIYYEKTNEVFYVDSVNHVASIQNGSVNRVTTLKVSRGLVKDYVKPATKKYTKSFNKQVGSIKGNVKEKQVSNMSYADLVDIELLREGLKELCIKMNKGFDSSRVVKKDENFESNTSLVISEVFNFFLSGKQFEGKVTPYIIYDFSFGSLGEIDGEQGKSGNGGSYSMRINTDSSSLSIENQMENQMERENTQERKEEIPRTSKVTNSPRSKVVKRDGMIFIE